MPASIAFSDTSFFKRLSGAIMDSVNDSFVLYGLSNIVQKVDEKENIYNRKRNKQIGTNRRYINA
jgi:hypothetical protein